MTSRYSVAPAQPAPFAVDVASGSPHLVTQRSIESSWRSLTSPLKTRGMTPSDYSQALEAEFYTGEGTKRFRDLASSTCHITLSKGEKARAEQVGQLLAKTGGATKLQLKTTTGARPLSGGRNSVDAETSLGSILAYRANGLGVQKKKKMPKRAVDPFRPAMIPHVKPKLVKPKRAELIGPQRQNYTYSPYDPIPNPALPPETVGQAFQFPYNTKPIHGRYQLNPQVRTAYYSTHWDDQRFNNPYQPYDVEVIQTVRAPNDVAADEEERKSPESKQPISPTPRNLLAASLGFGKRHGDYTPYLYHTETGLSQTGRQHKVDTTRTGSQTDCILMPVSSHLLQGLPSAASSSSAHGLALSVPYALARFVPQDPRDGAGQNGHLNASSLGYGKGHRNHYKYIFDNREGDPQLAYFRSNHVS